MNIVMKKIVSLILLTACLCGCNKEVAVELSVGQSEIEVTSAYTEINLPVTCNAPSSAAVEYDGTETGWIFLLPSVLNGNGVYTLWISEYDNVLEDRTAKLRITADTEVVEVPVTQLSKSSIGISPMNLATKAASGNYKVAVNCKRGWEATVEDDAKGWCTVDRTSGEGIGEIIVSVYALSGDSEVRTGHITFRSDALEVKMTVQHGYAQEIGGVIWSKANVDQPGYFGDTPDTRGMLYQYNSKKGWPNSSPDTSSCPEGMPIGQVDNGASDWALENDPCPEGWRVPTIDEIRAIVAPGQVKTFCWHDPETSGFAIPGAIAGVPGDEARTATKANMKGGIFIPQTGCRNKDTGAQDNWWSANLTSRTRPGQNWDMYVCWMDYSNSYNYNDFDGNRAAYPVRCVAITE